MKGLKRIIEMTIKQRPYSLLLIVSLQSLIVLVLATSPMEFLVKKLTDDAFYYYGTAYNLAAGLGMTFDGIHPTNGMQVIWIALLTPLYWVFDGRISPIRASILLQGVIAISTTIVLYKMLTSLYGRDIATIAVIALMFNPYVIFMYLGGHEASLNFLSLSVIIGLLVLRDNTDRTLVLLGLACGIAFLTRLDNVILLAVLGGSLIGSRIINDFRSLIAFSVPGTVFPVIYVLYNFLSFGHIIPVSGKVLGTADTSVVIAYVFVWGVLSIIITHIVSRVVNSVDTSTSDTSIFTVHQLVTVLTLGGVAHLGYYIFFHSRLSVWYLPVETVAATVIGAFLLTVAFKKLSIDAVTRNTYELATIFLVILLVGSYAVVGTATKLDPNQDELGYVHYKQAQYLQNNTACEAIIGSGSSGVLGYFAERHVVEWNGIANSYDFVSRYHGNESKYILEERPDYVVDYRPQVEVETLQRANYTRVRTESTVTEVQTPRKPITMVSPRNRRLVSEIWKSNTTSKVSNPNCGS